MICDGNGNVLVQDRKNPDWPGVIFPGGHVEPGESFVESVIREVFEETGLTIEDPVLCGIKQFPTKNGERYVVLFYRADRFSGALRSSDEGPVFWVSRQSLPSCPIAEDFMDMVRVFESRDLSEFYYYIEDGQWQMKLL
jgi:8-oxo-dGTP diphosphatase